MEKTEIVAEKTNTGYSAYASKYSVFTVGNDFTELKANIIEALNLYFEEDGKVITENDFSIAILADHNDGNLPQWQKDMIDRRKKTIENDPDSVQDIKGLFEELDREI